MRFRKISVVTPNYNKGRYLEETIDSVLSQNYPELEYIIVDGGSTDNSLDIIAKYKKHLSYSVSEPDTGMYDALNKGFRHATGEILGWVNSDDILHRNSLFTLNEIFTDPSVEWVQGYQSWIDRQGKIVRTSPVRIRSKYSYYLKEYHYGFAPFIQQESTFWKRSLWERAGSYISTEFPLAGDFELWMRFFGLADLHLVSTVLGAFRYYSGDQLSRQVMGQYIQEADAIIDTLQLSAHEKENLNRILRLKKYPAFAKIPLISRYYIRMLNKLYGHYPEINYQFKEGIFCLQG